MADAAYSAGFDSAGQTAMQRFIAGMESMRGAVMAKAREIANAAKNEINAAISGIGVGGGSGRAGGLDYVPYNGYPATLHAGEAVLTAREAKAWRAGETGNGGHQIVIHQHITSVPMTPVQLAAASEAYFEQARWQV